MLHLAITPSILDKKLASNINNFVYFFIAHSRNFENMTSKEEMGKKELGVLEGSQSPQSCRCMTIFGDA